MSISDCQQRSMSSQLSGDRSQRIHRVGPDNGLREPALLPPPHDLLDRRPRVARQYRERVHRPQSRRIRPRRHKRRNHISDHRHVQRQLHVLPHRQEVRRQPPSVSSDSECASHAMAPRRRVHPRPYPQVGQRRRHRQRRPRPGCHCCTSGISGVENPLSGIPRTWSRHVATSRDGAPTGSSTGGRSSSPSKADRRRAPTRTQAQLPSPTGRNASSKAQTSTRTSPSPSAPAALTSTWPPADAPTE